MTTSLGGGGARARPSGTCWSLSPGLWLSLRVGGVIRGCAQWKASVMFRFLKGLKGTKRASRGTSEEATAKPEEWQRRNRERSGVSAF